MNHRTVKWHLADNYTAEELAAALRVRQDREAERFVFSAFITVHAEDFDAAVATVNALDHPGAEIEIDQCIE